MKKLFILASLVALLSGCFTPKFIPFRYFNEEHRMAVKVRNFPSPTHNMSRAHHDESDPIKKLEIGLEAARQTLQLQTIFSQINY
ncbi:MAG: membrane lipoprotein lipid attachment site-containing protein [Myxococcales bacterium]|nr:membrane lipoprotein lipid attachment site-containing protein [Myxococcales bacterium]USN51084.1 MAG: membrane lipoprotein lipid attachment site-containing protein [Myxococcales bacterium]